jgi:sterol desaturase/sphingolipid hydroxylase (fatty acid hydroxylase superfamily)
MKSFYWVKSLSIFRVTNMSNEVFARSYRQSINIEKNNVFGFEKTLGQLSISDGLSKPFFDFLKSWPVAVSLPLAVVTMIELGNITVKHNHYEFNSIYPQAWHHTFLGPELLIAAFISEIICIGWKNSSLFAICFDRTKSMWTDIAYFVSVGLRIVHLIGLILSFGFSVLSWTWVRAHVVEATGLDLRLDYLPIMPQFFVALILLTFLDYWSHRFEHSNLFWPLHRFHHAAEDFCILTSVRVHPVSLLDPIIVTAPLVLIGTSPAVLVAISVVVVHVRWLIHSRIPGRWGWFGTWILQSAESHRRHHILDEALVNKNYALAPLWDHLFGTWAPECDHQTPIGVTDSYRQGAWYLPDMWREYCNLFSNLANFFGLARFFRASKPPKPAE